MEEKKKKSIGHILIIKNTDIEINRFVFVEMSFIYVVWIIYLTRKGKLVSRIFFFSIYFWLKDVLDWMGSIVPNMFCSVFRLKS